MGELRQLFPRHWSEIALYRDKVPLDPDWDMYFALHRMKRLALLTCRDEGRLVGYLLYLVNPLLHYRTVIKATSDLFWLEPGYRAGMAGVRLFKNAEPGLKRAGVQIISNVTKHHFENGRVGKIFERLGYTKTGEIYDKWIGA